jgi:hypothetical protein
MGLVFKNLSKDNIQITPHTAHKQWDLSLAESAAIGIKSYKGSYVPGEFNISDPDVGSTATEATTTDGYYQRLVHAGIDKLYYGSDGDAINTYCNRDLSKQKREFTDKVTVFSVPRQICGDNIHPGTLVITSGSYKLSDDSNGNLLDITDTNQYSDPKHDSAYIGLWEGYRYLGLGVQKELELKVASKYSLIGNARQVEFVDGKWGQGIEFTGAISEDPITNSRIELHNSAQMDFDEDFSIGLWVKAPTNQATTASYSKNEGEGNMRSLSNHGVNSIITKREWWGGHCPFAVRIYNQNAASANQGKVSVLRKSKASLTGETNVKSTSTINDNAWHHICFTKTGNVLKLYIDGTLEATETDSAHDLVTRTTCNIFVGGRKYGKRTHNGNYWVGENIIHPFKGSMDEIRLFDKGLTAAEVTLLYSSINNSNRVGNVMYEHGIATITTPSNTTKDLYHSSSFYDSFAFKGSQDVTEHMYICNVLDGEYNSSFNNTLRVKQDPKSDTMQSYVTSSHFSPYVTTVGLYNDQGDLCAVAKLAQPVKNPSDYDTSYQIRFDTN